jgi:molecular chaperone DnaK (HSP70)
MNDMKEIIIGIDLGTTNSEVAVIKDSHPVLIKNRDTVILPSFVGIDQDGNLLVGEEARNQYAVYPERTIKSVKRLMGTDKPVEMAGKQYSPQEISAIILRTLKEIAQTHLGQPISKAVITVPAYFSDVQRQATREAGEIAGLDVVKMINEPTAAALAYEGSGQGGKTILVYDLGGGTFDVSVVTMENGVIEVVASHGNNQLGGDDFDKMIIEHIKEHLRDEHGSLLFTPESAARLDRAAEQAKITLSDNPYVKISEEYLLEKDGVPVHLDLEISRQEYEEMIAPYIEESMDAVHIALQGAGLTASAVDEVLLVGGSSRTPMVYNFFESEFGILPRCEMDPELCVAAGAAIQAGMVSGQDVDTVLVDITPYTFSTASLVFDHQRMGYDLACIPMIKKNTPVPVKKSEVFYTTHDDQEKVIVKVYQGESTIPDENVLIGEFRISGLSRVPKGNEIIDTFELDSNGILHVTSVEKRTGKSNQIEIANAMTRLDNEEVDQARNKIGELFSEPPESDQKAAEQGTRDRETGKSRSVIARAVSLIKDADPEDQEELGELIKSVEEAKKTGEKDQLARAMEELEDILFYLES